MAMPHIHVYSAPHSLGTSDEIKHRFSVNVSLFKNLEGRSIKRKAIHRLTLPHCLNKVKR